MSLADQLRAGEIPTGPGPLVRSKQLKASFRPGEVEDLKAIAEDWGVPVSTVVWAICHDQLSRYRKKAPEYGRHGLSIAAAVSVLRFRTAPRWFHADGARAKARKAVPEQRADEFDALPGFQVSEVVRRDLDERLGRKKEPAPEPPDQPLEVPEAPLAVTSGPPRSNLRALKRLLGDRSDSIE